MTRRKRYSAEFKREALRRANEEGITKHTLDVIAHTRPYRHGPIRSSSPGCFSRKQSFSRPTQNDAEGRKTAISGHLSMSFKP